MPESYRGPPDSVGRIGNGARLNALTSVIPTLPPGSAALLGSLTTELAGRTLNTSGTLCH
ncbi:hypothetical protein GCM10009837_05490 [Streptomyces durmitorensis]